MSRAPCVLSSSLHSYSFLSPYLHTLPKSPLSSPSSLCRRGYSSAPCLLSPPFSLHHPLSKPASISSPSFLQKRHKSKKALIREHKQLHRFKSKHTPPIKTPTITNAKTPEEEGWIPLANPPPPKIHEPSVQPPPPIPKEDLLHQQTILEGLERLGFLEKLKNLKENSWGKAFCHKFFENKVTSPAYREHTVKGTLALEAALREYMYNRFPFLPPQAMVEACKWFSSPVATARFAKFLKFDEMVYFSFATPVIPAENDYEAYRLLEPAERVSLLASTYTGLIGIIYKEGGIDAVIPLLDQQVKWVEGLKINFITEKEPVSKTAERKRKLAAALQSPFPQPHTHLPNWIASSLLALYAPVRYEAVRTDPARNESERTGRARNPKKVAEYYLSRYGFGVPAYRVIRESNRLSRVSAVFLVGVFKADNTFIAQGFGGSIKQAENEAAKSALRLVVSKPNEKYTFAPINYLKS